MLTRNERGPRIGLLIEQSRVPAAWGPGAPAPRPVGCWAGLVGGGGGPEEAGQFAGAGDDDDVVGLAAGAHALMDAVESLLGAVGDLQDVVWLAELAVGQCRAQAWLTGVVPGCFDEQPAGQR